MHLKLDIFKTNDFLIDSGGIIYVRDCTNKNKKRANNRLEKQILHSNT